MAVRPIRLFGDPVLRSVCDPVAPRRPARWPPSSTTSSTPCTVPGRAGLAATQIGVDLRAFSYNIDGDIGYVINPGARRGVGASRELVDEGCLSVPGFCFPRLRYPFARVTGIDLDGNPVELER